MYETVKTVNGYEIYRSVGTHGFYYLDLRAGVGYTFRTIKAAAAFAATLPAQA